MIQNVCVFCGSSSGHDPVYAEAARAVGEILAERQLDLVYGGGRVGLMGIVADTILARGRNVVGVIPRRLARKELLHDGLPDLRVVSSMHERKALMADLADAFLALPGGLGTMDELFEILTWGQLGEHAKPVGILNTLGYYDPMLRFVDDMTQKGFLKEKYRELFIVDREPAPLIEKLLVTRPPQYEKWIDRQST